MTTNVEEERSESGTTPAKRTSGRWLTKKEQEAAKKKAEKEERARIEDEERRVKEDQIIEQIEKDFWENSKKMSEGAMPVIQAEPRRGAGVPVAATSLDSVISDEDLDRLVQYFEDGGQMTLEPRNPTPAGLPGVDGETLEKAQRMVEVLTASLEEGEQRRAQQAAERRQGVKAEQEALARGEECELERMLREKLEREAREACAALDAASAVAKCDAALRQTTNGAAEQEHASEAQLPEECATPCESESIASAAADVAGTVEPKFHIEVVEEDGAAARVVVKVELPLVTSAGDIEADIVSGQVFELSVPDLYAMRTELPCTIDEENMSCRFDKKKKMLTVKLPVVS